jgi:D-alanyl-lipoteichoic acid acyltransferase DltB (MBOAT superfamily)
MWLLAASYYFYMSWNVKLIVLILSTTIISWSAGVLMQRSQTKQRRRLWLILAAGVSLGVLFFFKYFDFASTSIAAIMGRIGLPMNAFTLNLVLPVGISFYTFQTLGYVIDVYRGDLKAENHFGIYALFVIFFPQLVAGPIERAGNLLPQFRVVHTPDAKKMAWGLRYICWGMLKKVVIADYIAVFVNATYNNLSLYTPMTWVLATLLFAVQIFCDFSGYTDIARGSATMMGFDLMENFKAPYLVRSIREFWRRWHISLSTWFMDYVYIPLGGNRVGRYRHIFNLFVTFVLSGLWHGARWNFVLWGVYHGIFIVIDVLTAKTRQKWEDKIQNKALMASLHTVQVLLTFILVCFGWMLFRANDLGSIVQIVRGLPAAFAHPIANLSEAYTSLVGGGDRLVRILASVLALFVFDAILYRGKDPFSVLAQKKAPARIFVSYALTLAVIIGALTMPEGVTVEFIYFQF